MNEQEKREEVIQAIAEMLRKLDFTFEYVVKKKQAGIKIIYEVTQAQMNSLRCF